MSLVLAPIHDIMYQKVLRQDRMPEALLQKAEEKGWVDQLRQRAEIEAPAAVQRPLADIIDQRNIHGWLNQALQISEKRFALIAAHILTHDPARLKELRESMYALGAAEGVPQGNDDAHDVYRWLESMLLDGMPCDRTIEVDRAHQDAVMWRTVCCSHTPHWEEQGLTGGWYYQLRNAWIEGALSESNFVYRHRDNAHSLEKVD